MPWPCEQPVREVTKLQPARSPPGKVAVVDRPGWIRANVDGFRVVLDPLAEQLRQRSPAASAGGLVMGGSAPGSPGSRPG